VIEYPFIITIANNLISSIKNPYFLLRRWGQIANLKTIYPPLGRLIRPFDKVF